MQSAKGLAAVVRHFCSHPKDAPGDNGAFPQANPTVVTGRRPMDPAMIVALTIWREARGESPAGRKAVASVIWNRAVAKRNCQLGSYAWGQRLKSVCLKPKQFSCWNGEAGATLKKSNPSGQVWEECKALAGLMVCGDFEPSTYATHYYAYHRIKEPAWAATMTPAIIVGNHLFFE